MPDMPSRNQPTSSVRIGAEIRARIPAEELEHIRDVLKPLVNECRNGFEERLYRVDPVGTFRPDEP